MKKFPLRSLAALGLVFLVVACASSEGNNGPTRYRVGNPYEINGKRYYPQENFSYDETGIASWYGADFHNKKTASGEIFDKDELTAAHKTLPLPSLVRVTNLDNGRSVVVRVNDRGPFVPGRIIDVSQRAAELLGFEGNGTAKVRVSILSQESLALAQAGGRTGRPGSVQVAHTAQPDPYLQPASAYFPAVAVKPAKVDVTEFSSVQEPQLNTVPGKIVDHRFLPASVVNVVPVQGQQNIWIQVGSFTVPGNADRLKGQVANLGPVVVTPRTVNNIEYHRVRIGPLPSVQKADQVLQQAMTLGFNKARVVIE